MTRLLRTATFRLSLLHVVLTALSAAVVLGFVHFATVGLLDAQTLSLIHISEPTRLRRISYAVFRLKNKNLYVNPLTQQNR